MDNFAFTGILIVWAMLATAAAIRMWWDKGKVLFSLGQARKEKDALTREVSSLKEIMATREEQREKNKSREYRGPSDADDIYRNTRVNRQ